MTQDYLIQKNGKPESVLVDSNQQDAFLLVGRLNQICQQADTLVQEAQTAAIKLVNADVHYADAEKQRKHKEEVHRERDAFLIRYVKDHPPEIAQLALSVIKGRTPYPLPEYSFVPIKRISIDTFR